jgi:hypothetical protein
MFAASKPLASLSSGLLARKGQARPAMRPQGFASMTGMGSSLEDLGWNDMGSAEAHAAPPPASETPPVAVVTEAPAEPVPVPPVLAQREALREELEAAPVPSEPVEEPVAAIASPVTPEIEEAEPATATATAESPAEPIEAVKPVSVATATRLARESAQQTRKAGRAAFTLRLDSERHLRLRLASALTGRSAQQLVTGALDTMLKELTAVELLVAQLPAPKKPGRKGAI